MKYNAYTNALPFKYYIGSFLGGGGLRPCLFCLFMGTGGPEFWKTCLYNTWTLPYTGNICSCDMCPYKRLLDPNARGKLRTIQTIQTIQHHSDHSECKFKLYAVTYSQSFRTIQQHSAPFSTIQEHSAPFRSIQDHSGPFRTIKCHSGPLRTIQDHSEPFKTIQEHSSQFSTI